MPINFPLSKITGYNQPIQQFNMSAHRFTIADFDWTLYLGLAFITAVCFAFGTALICCARRGIRTNPHYNMARSGEFKGLQCPASVVLRPYNVALVASN